MTAPSPVDDSQGIGASRALAAVLRHVDDWGRAWFGLIFWGSVLFATARRLWPDASELPLGAGSLLLGLGAGLVARRRGYWL